MRSNLLLLFAVSLAWASDYLFFIRWADAALPPLAIGAVTSIIAAIVLFLLVWLVLKRPLLPILREAPLVPVVLGATSVAWPRITVAYAEESITPDIAAITGTTVPILTLLVSIFILHQQNFSPLRMLGVLVALGGLAVFVGLGGIEGRNTADAILVLMSSGVTFVFAGFYAQSRAARFDKAALTVWVMAAGAAMLAVPAFVLEFDHIAMPPAAALASLVASGTIAMALAYLGYFILIERAGPSFAALYAYLVPPLGVLIGVIFLGEALTLRHGGGLALVLVGLWLITGRQAKPVSG
ncbi:MAG: DMT family transporter [Dongiaceae bacterium]